MVTDSGRATSTGIEAGFLPRWSGRLRQVICGLHGHDELLHFEEERISLQCVSCGYQSPGWEVKRPSGRPESASAAPARRARILRLPLVNHRNVA